MSEPTNTESGERSPTFVLTAHVRGPTKEHWREWLRTGVLPPIRLREGQQRVYFTWEERPTTHNQGGGRGE